MAKTWAYERNTLLSLFLAERGDWIHPNQTP
jgi:hypothetical protein